MFEDIPRDIIFPPIIIIIIIIIIINIISPYQRNTDTNWYGWSL